MTKLALIGVGGWGSNYLRLLADGDSEYVIVDPSPDAVTDARVVSSAPIFASVDQILGDETIGAAIIATPARTHNELTRLLLEHGKHVLVEKPVAFEVAELDELYRLADERSLVLMSGHLLQHHPAVREMVSLIKAGRLGEVQHVSSTRSSLGQVRTDENVLWSLAPHDMSLTLEVFQELPETIRCWGVQVFGSVADVATCHLSLANGATALVHVSWLSPVKQQQLVVYGSEGVIVFDDRLEWDAKLSLTTLPRGTALTRPMSSRVLLAASATAIPLQPRPPLAAQLSEFLSAVGGSGSAERDRWLARSVTSMLQTADISMALGGDLVTVGT
jgi:UDP-2-acetamido-3-amino-2,3-dideoxy-glucuronate N-acetyltransferase